MSLTGNITGFQHLGLPVANIEKSIDFYTGLGFRISGRYELDEDGGITFVAFLDLNGFCIELYQSAGGPEPGRGKTGPIDHLTLDVRNIDTAFEEIKSSGYTLINDEPVYLPLQANGVKYFMVLGPDGEKVEFNQIL